MDEEGALRKLGISPVNTLVVGRVLWSPVLGDEWQGRRHPRPFSDYRMLVVDMERDGIEVATRGKHPFVMVRSSESDPWMRGSRSPVWDAVRGWTLLRDWGWRVVVVDSRMGESNRFASHFAGGASRHTVRCLRRIGAHRQWSNVKPDVGLERHEYVLDRVRDLQDDVARDRVDSLVVSPLGDPSVRSMSHVLYVGHDARPEHMPDDIDAPYVLVERRHETGRSEHYLVLDGLEKHLLTLMDPDATISNRTVETNTEENGT